MSLLFGPMTIKHLKLRNRFVRSATYDHSADPNGHVTDNQLTRYAELADGGVGLIITGIAYVHESGRLSSAQNSIAHDDCIPGLRQLTTVVHERGAKIAVQLFHAGREARRDRQIRKKPTLAPSIVYNDPYFSKNHRSMTEEEIWTVIYAFGDAAKRAVDAGFDAVQLHGAHAYLLSQFLSPFTNRRVDHWGGDLENRLHFHQEVYRAIRAKVGLDYPILIKLGVQDEIPGGLEFKEGIQAAQLLAQLGFDALEISQGLRGERYAGTEFRTNINNIMHEAYFRDWAREIKDQVEVPVMTVGGLRSFKLMEQIIQNGEADFISLCRPLIREPRLINDWSRGDYHRATCISCNQCLDKIIQGKSLYCVKEGKLNKEN